MQPNNHRYKLSYSVVFYPHLDTILSTDIGLSIKRLFLLLTGGKVLLTLNDTERKNTGEKEGRKKETY